MHSMTAWSIREKIAIASAIANLSVSGRSKDHVMPGIAMLFGGGGLGGTVLFPSLNAVLSTTIYDLFLGKRETGNSCRRGESRVGF
jgi:hypothetical protein